MKIISKLFLAEKTILTLDGDILSMNPSKVIVDGKEYEFTVAYDVKNTIGIDVNRVYGDEVTFVP